jgi:iron(III) transport system ATP-binding protein
MNQPKTRSTGVRIENLSLSFGETEVLRDVNLDIQDGEFFAFLGPSGSGKSTLLRAIAGFGPKPGGRILIGERDIAGLPPWKRDVGMVFQSYALWPHMSVRKNVAFGLEERRLQADEIAQRVDKALDLVGLRHLAERKPSELSGGQQQRIALARTIVIEPKVLLLDEPLSNLDANLRIQMRREIRELQQELKLTTIFVTHDQEEANTTSDRMAVLDQGVIQQVGEPIKLYDEPANLFVARFLGTANILEGAIETHAGDSCFRCRNGASLDLKAAHRHGDSAIVFRPQNVEITAQGSSGEDAQNRIIGTVSHMEFLGSVIRYSVDIGDDQVMIDHPHKQGEATFAVNTRVDLIIDQEGIRVLAA